MNIEQASESRARRSLSKQGLRLTKAPSRHWTRKEFGVGYQIVDDRNNVVAGCGQREFEMTLDEVVAFAESVSSFASVRVVP